MPNQPTAPVLVEVTRGPAVESSHRGQIVEGGCIDIVPCRARHNGFKCSRRL